MVHLNKESLGNYKKFMKDVDNKMIYGKNKSISKELSDEELDSMIGTLNEFSDDDKIWTKDELIKALDSLSDLEEDIKGFERY